MAVLLCGCSASKAEEKKGSGSYTNEGGEKTTAKITMKDDKIVDVDIDETVKGKEKTKKELKDEYNMKQASPIKKEWYEQAEYFEKYVEKNGIDKVKVGSEGKAENDDVKSGCTIAVDGFVKAIKAAQENAK